jgi:dUTP pyrophosphatase
MTPIERNEILSASKLEFQLLSPAAILPTRAHSGDAGLDLYAANAVYLAPGVIAVVDTDLAVSIPYGFEGQVRGRSGLAFKNLVLCVHNGTIDHGYTGPIKVLMQNASTEPYTIAQGTRFAQLVVSSVLLWAPKAVDGFEESVRGVNGFGSTGK